MSLCFTRKEEAFLIQLYMDVKIRESLGLLDKKPYEWVNKQLDEAKIYTVEVKQNSRAKNHTSDIQSQLMKVIYKNIYSADFHWQLRDRVYTLLDKKYKFDTNVSNRPAMSKAFQAIMLDFHMHERKSAKRRSLNSTLLFSCFLITIPFAYFYYKECMKENESRCLYKTKFVDNIQLKLRGKYANQYGLIQKNQLKSDKENFKEVLFSKKNCGGDDFITRKLLISDKPVGGRKGLTFLGFQYQFSKISDDHNFNEYKELDDPSQKKLHKLQKATKLSPEICQFIQDLSYEPESTPKPKSAESKTYSKERLDKEWKSKALIKELSDKLNRQSGKKLWRTGLFGITRTKHPNTVKLIAKQTSSNFYSYSKKVNEVQLVLEKSLAKRSFTRSKSTTTFYKECLTMIENAESKIDRDIRLGLDQDGNPAKINAL